MLKPYRNAFVKTRLDLFSELSTEYSQNWKTRLDPVRIMIDALNYIDPNVENMLLIDIKEETLVGELSALLEVVYLSPSHAPPSFPVEGIVFRTNMRLMINMVVSKRSVSINVIFLVDTGSPYTYLTRQVWQALGFHENIPVSSRVQINGITMDPFVSSHNFEEVNVLGSDFLSLNMRLIVDYGLRSVIIERKT